MKIEICPTCKGDGNIKLTNWELDYKTCSVCNGTGRVLTRNYSYVVPFNTDKNKIYKVDSKIIELIRDLEKNK